MRKSDFEESILQLRREGRTYNEIVKILNCSKSLVSYHAGGGQKDKSRERRKSRIKALNRLPSYIRSFYRLKEIIKDKTYIFSDFERDYPINNKCYISGIEIDLSTNLWEFDHVIPKSRGGDDTPENLRIADKKVNRIKHDLKIEELLECCKNILENNGYLVSEK